MTHFKHFLALILIFASALGLRAQDVPQAINFQAIARDANSEAMANTPIMIQLTILSGSPEGELVYREIRSLTTNAYGSFSFQIGRDPYMHVNEFADIDWAGDRKFLKIDYDPTATLSFNLSLGTIEFVSVPYAFAAGAVSYIDASGAADGDVLAYNATTGRFEPVAMSGVGGGIAVETDPTVPDWAKADTKPTYDYSEIQNTPEIPTVPTAVSAFENDANYITSESQTMADVAALGNSVNAQIKNLVNPTDAQDAVTKAYVDSLISVISSLAGNVGNPPTVTTDSVNNLTSTSAWCYGTLVEVGDAFASNLGICYSINPNPTTANRNEMVNGGAGSSVYFFPILLTGLSAGTTYYFRAFAVNSYGTSYGNEMSFVTPYTLTFDKNGGVGSMHFQYFTPSTPQAIRTNAFTKNYYTFAGWNTAANGTGTSYVDEQVITLDENLTLYAQWEPITYTVTFDANGGSGTMDLQTFNAGTAQALRANTFTRTNYTFIGWNTAADGTGTSYTDGQSITLSANMTLYAQWQNRYCIVTFLANGGSGSMSPQTFVNGEAQTLSANTFTRTGSTFGGWATSANGNVVYADQMSITISEDITLYAKWNTIVNGHTYVDLGLPSGIKWATCNVGADVPEEYGDYFAWGETTTKETYNFSNYSDNPTTLPASADAATVNWGSSWRMPTQTEMQELIDNCTWQWTTLNGVNGYRVTGTNGNSIFLPAAGYRLGTETDNVGSYGDYWSSSLYSYSGYTDNAWYLSFDSGNRSVYSGGYRGCGRSVRPVRP